MSAESKNVKAKNPLCVGITTEPRVYLTPDRAQLMIKMFSDRLIEKALLGYNCPQFKSNPRLYEGVILTELWDQSSKESLQYKKEWKNGYEYTVYTLQQITFENIPDVLPAYIAECDIPKRRKCSLSVDYSAPAWDIHKILIKHNTNYQMNLWYYYGAEKSKDSSVVTLTYYVPEETLAKVKDANCEVSFGLGTVKLLIHCDS